MSQGWSNLSLWPNQQAALKNCEAYLASPKRAALVQMPTGTGKTGVIAVLCSKVSTTGAVLVVSPSKGLAEQLRTDIASDFWSKIGASDRWLPRHVQHLLPSLRAENTQLLEKESGLGVVLVGTLVSLAEIQKLHGADYAALGKFVELIIVDEGHREPAAQWAAAVRGLQKPTILFSATPYRNDLRQFDVSNDWIHFLSFRDALRQRLIRDVAFESLGSDGTSASFARELIARFDQHLASGRIHKDSRVVVRCGSHQSVRSVYDALAAELQNRPERCLALHDAFSGETAPLYSNVPNIRKQQEIFLVHQYKLTEGIDDPRCMLLAIFEEFDNERQLVQQIGRILRHPTPLKHGTAPALVLADDIHSIEAKWKAYRLFDRVCDESGGKPPLRNSVETLQRMFMALPKADYVGGKFREVVDFTNDAVAAEVQVPRSCLLYRLGTTRPKKPTQEAIRKLLQDEDRTIVHSSKSQGDRVMVFLALVASESPFLNRSLFPTLGLEVTVAVTCGEYLFFYDSGGLYIDDVIEARRLEIDEIKGLMPASANGKITSISVLNGDIGPAAVRSRTIGAASLADAVPFMGDNAYFISRAAGRLEDGNRRYLGFTRARIRDNEGEYAPLDEFIAWADSLARSLQSNPTPSEFFERFASPVPVPKDTTPANILLEVSAIEHDFIDRDKKSLDVTDACADIVADGTCPDSAFQHSFTVSINGTPHKVWLRWDSERSKYILLSPKLEQYHQIGKPKVTLAGRLNLGQDFRIILTSARTLYAAGQFYDFRKRFAKGGAATLLLDLLTTVPDLAGISSEKGTLPRGVRHPGWDPDSLFHYVDQNMDAAGEFGLQFSHVVCDDMGTEGGDFIGIAENNSRVVFAQAKCKRDPAQVSASALYDVCSQANKNLGFLRYAGRELPGRVRKWNGAWKGGAKGLTYEVRPRIRRGPTTAQSFLDDVNGTLTKPATRREMWLILGQILSKKKFRKQLESKRPAASAVQTFYLLMGAHTVCKSVGVELKVFCSP